MRLKLGDIAREFKSTLKDTTDLPVVGLEHLDSGDIFLARWDENTEHTFTKGFKQGHILFGRRRAYLKKAVVAPFDGVCSGDITIIEAIPEMVDPELLPFIIQNDTLFDFAFLSPYKDDYVWLSGVYESLKPGGGGGSAVWAALGAKTMELINENMTLKNHCKDFISGREMDFTVYKAESIDIHHIFPKDHCEKKGYPKTKWNSVVNKTPITYSTNREIGGVAPSVYLARIEKKGLVTADVLNEYLATHLIDVQACRADDFDKYFILRATAILDAIESATGKEIAGRDSDLVVRDFGGALK